MVQKRKCDKCGFEINTLEYDDIEDYECPICPSGKLEEKKQEIDLKAIVNKDCIDSFKQQIEEYGNDLMWAMIERNIHNAITRLYYRKYFFLAGGKCPKGEVKI